MARKNRKPIANKTRYVAAASLLALAAVPGTAPTPVALPANLGPSPQLNVDGGTARFLTPPSAPPAAPVSQVSHHAGPERAHSAAPSALMDGIPRSALRAYNDATSKLAERQPGCGLPVALLAAIGQVESGHALGGDVDANGTTLTPILGPTLDGSPGVAAIRDTDSGAYDGDPVWDHATGPMQFIPSTWRAWAADGNADGAANPHNIYDSALAAGNYLCAGGRDLRRPSDLTSAILSYNHSAAYLSTVLAWVSVYSGGMIAVPDQQSVVGSRQNANHANAAAPKKANTPKDTQVAPPPPERTPPEDQREGSGEKRPSESPSGSEELAEAATDAVDVAEDLLRDPGSHGPDASTYVPTDQDCTHADNRSPIR